MDMDGARLWYGQTVIEYFELSLNSYLFHRPIDSQYLRAVHCDTIPTPWTNTLVIVKV
jgi:hypothetical protein